MLIRNDPYGLGYAMRGIGDNTANAIGDSDGNVTDSYEDQDQRGTLPGALRVLGDACFKDRCKKHDQCYSDNSCNASSWITSYFRGNKSCNQCNSNF
jgi:hypothetical protein